MKKWSATYATMDEWKSRFTTCTLFSVCLQCSSSWFVEINERRIRTFFWRLHRLAVPSPTQPRILFSSLLQVPYPNHNDARGALSQSQYIACVVRPHKIAADTETSFVSGGRRKALISFLHKSRPLIAVVTWWCVCSGARAQCWNRSICVIAQISGTPGSTAETTHATLLCFTTHRPQTSANWIATVLASPGFVPTLAS